MIVKVTKNKLSMNSRRVIHSGGNWDIRKSRASSLLSWHSVSITWMSSLESIPPYCSSKIWINFIRNYLIFDQLLYTSKSVKFPELSTWVSQVWVKDSLWATNPPNDHLGRHIDNTKSRSVLIYEDHIRGLLAIPFLELRRNHCLLELWELVQGPLISVLP